MNGIQIRNRTLDIYKSVLIILVVIRHALQYSTADEGAILTNIIWSVQMPGFMMVSGYFSAKTCSNKYEILKEIKKASIRYLLPFISWYVLIEILVIGKHDRDVIMGLRQLFQNVSSGLWYLWVVYILSFAAIFCNYIAQQKKACGIKLLQLIIFLCMYTGGIIILAKITSRAWFGISLVSYYSIYYGFGWFVRVTQHIWGGYLPKIKNIGLFTCMGIWLFIVWNVDLYHAKSELFFRISRYIAGFVGNAVILGVIKDFENILDKMGFAWIGRFTLEIYVTHQPLNRLFAENIKASFFTVEGFENFVCSLFCTVFFSIIVIMVFKSNNITNFLFYGKVRKKVLG